MTACFQTLFILVLVHVSGGSSQSRGYRNSFLLTRLARNRVSKLLTIYKEEQLGDKHFEDRSLHLNELPTLSTDLHRWLSLEDQERLSEASHSLQVYSSMLSSKREQILAEAPQQQVPRGVRPTLGLPERLHHVELDLRDLMRRLHTLLEWVRNSKGSRTPREAPIVSPLPPLPQRGTQTAWVRRLEVYVILRDLELYLTRTARDLLLLDAKHRPPPC